RQRGLANEGAEARETDVEHGVGRGEWGNGDARLLSQLTKFKPDGFLAWTRGGVEHGAEHFHGLAQDRLGRREPHSGERDILNWFGRHCAQPAHNAGGQLIDATPVRLLEIAQNVNRARAAENFFGERKRSGWLRSLIGRL